MPYSAKRLRLFALTALVTPVFQTAGFAQQSLNLRDINSLQLKQVQPSSEDRNFIQGALAAGDTVFGDTSRRFDSFSFDGQAGQVMRITVTSASFVPVVLLVEESTGQVIGNQTGDANTVSLTQQLPQDGQYVLRVTSVEVPGEGDYQFQIVEIREVIRSETEADRLFNQGYDLALQGQFEAAISLYEQALAIYQEMSDRAGEMLTLLNLGLAHNAFGQYEQAISFYEPLLNFAQEDTANTESQLKQRQWEGDALGGLAISYRELGQYERAISLFQEQIPILQELEDRFEEGRALGRLGIAYRVSERYEQAIEVLLQRIDIAREIDDRAGEGSGLGNLGLAYDGLGQYEEAIEAFEQRLVITRELNQLDRESLTLGNMAETYVNLGEIEEAIALLQQGLKIAREINYTDQEVRILDRLESLSVFSTSTGSEILAVEDVLDENSREIALGFDDGEPVSRRLSNTHQIQGIAGQNILIHLESSDFVPYIVLVNETEGFAQQSTSETTLQDDAWVVATLPVDGTYDVWVTMQDPEGQGSYQLTITQADAAALLLSDAANYFRQASEQYDSKNFQEALRLNEQSLNLYRSDAVRERFEELSLMQESRLLGNIGNVYDGLREYETAIEFQEQAIDLKRQIEDHSGEAFSLNNLGRTYRRSGADDLAIKAYQQALMIWREINNSLGE
ncbi:MAG: tetratricopeptide repeat protein, partial [Cyanobacteria bacterium P01_D01_bin.115]